MKGADFTFRQCDDLDVGERHPLVDAGHILLIARQSVHGFGEDDIKPPATSVRNQCLDTRAAEHRSAGNFGIRIFFYDIPTHFLRMEPANPELIEDGCFSLIITRIARV